ncbi:MAG: hypothetical protein JO345_04560 [Streptosporangiaceae bacterium]|nr:hypothetical protein [Streptosporangiaceae bacterium]
MAWLSLDEYDNQPDLFWPYLLAALRRADIPAMPGFAGNSWELPRLAAILAGLRQPGVLVLDNLHLLHAPRLITGLRYVLAHASPGLRVIASSRTDPPLPLHQYLLTGDLTEIRASHLAFTPAEARLLLHKHGVTLSSEAFFELLRRTEGWAAGLRLAALDLHEHPGNADRKPAGMADPTAAYLTGEVLDAQPRRVRDFLLRTSVPDTVSPELAMALTGREHDRITLSALVRANMFIEPAEDGWYRYHHLFREVLQARLRYDSPDVMTALQRQTADWFRRRGRLADALRLAVRADDWQLASGIVVDELAVSTLLDPEDGRGLARSLRAIPLREEWQVPQPYLATAAVALSGLSHPADREDESGTVRLGQAEDILRRLGPDDEVPSRLAATLIRFKLAQRMGQLEAMAAAAQEAAVQLGQLPAEVRARHPEAAFYVLAMRGTAALWLGHLDEAEQILAEAEMAHVPEAPPAVHAYGIGCRAVAAALHGRLNQAVTLAAKAFACRRLDSPSGEPLPNLLADIALGFVHLERYELTEVRESLKRVEAGLRTHRDRAAASVASLVAAGLFLAEGRHTAADNMLARARQGWSPPDWLEHRLTLAEARSMAMAGNILAALDAADRCSRYSSFDAATSKAVAWAAAGDFRKAQQALGHADGPADRSDRDLPMIDMLLVDARIHYENADPETCTHSLARAFRIGRGEGYRLPFASQGDWLPAALRADAELMRGYRTLFPPAHGGQAKNDGKTTVPGDAVIEPLTEREQQVLKRVAQMLNTAEIASDLYISVNTVKTHLKSIHRKLAVTDRRGAVRRARQLSML